MTAYYAQSAGNFNAITWKSEPGGGGSSPDGDYPSLATDVAVANGYAVAINVNTLSSVARTATGGTFSVAAGGPFTVGNIIDNGGLVTPFVTVNGQALTVLGSIYGSPGSLPANITGATLVWQATDAVVPDGYECYIQLVTTTAADFTGLQVANSGKIGIANLSSGTITITNAAISNMTATAQALVRNLGITVNNYSAGGAVPALSIGGHFARRA